MRIIEPSYEILTEISDGGIKELQHIEKIGRVCYKSEDKITEDGESAKKFVQMLISRGHEAMIEHSTLSVKFTVDRGVSHELVRHRIASFAQESTRYCNYSKDKFGKEITVIEPLWLSGKNVLEWEDWERAIRTSEMQYFKLLDKGWSPQEARGVLPNDLKTEVVVTANETEWQHIVNLRSKQTTGKAHPQMVEVMTPVYEELKVLSEGRIK